jgi:hypothetical protein
VICLIYLIKKIKRKALTGKETIKIIFIVIAVITIIFSIAGCVIKTKDLNMIDVLYVNQTKIKIAYRGKLLLLLNKI